MSFWATLTGYRTEPEPGYIAQGFTPGFPIPAAFLNWILWKIGDVFGEEHDPDTGAHTDITADSVEVAGDALTYSPAATRTLLLGLCGKQPVLSNPTDFKTNVDLIYNQTYITTAVDGTTSTIAAFSFDLPAWLSNGDVTSVVIDNDITVHGVAFGTDITISGYITLVNAAGTVVAEWGNPSTAMTTGTNVLNRAAGNYTLTGNASLVALFVVSSTGLSGRSAYATGISLTASKGAPE